MIGLRRESREARLKELKKISEKGSKSWGEVSGATHAAFNPALDFLEWRADQEHRDLFDFIQRYPQWRTVRSEPRADRERLSATDAPAGGEPSCLTFALRWNMKLTFTG